MPGDPSEQTQVRGARARSEARVAAGVREFAVLRLAVGLGMSSDPARAAKLAGVLLADAEGKPREPTEEELAELVELAGVEAHEALRIGRQHGLAALLNRFAMLNAISLLEQEPLLQPKERAFAGRLAQQAVEDLGGRKAIYPKVSVNFGRPRKA